MKNLQCYARKLGGFCACESIASQEQVCCAGWPGTYVHRGALQLHVCYSANENIAILKLYKSIRPLLYKALTLKPYMGFAGMTP